MPTNVIMPQMGESIAEGTLTKWLKKPGDAVKRDEPLFEISTDKVDAEIPSPGAGTLLEILVPEGQTVAINTVVAPATAYDAKGLLKAAIRDDDPVLFLEHKFLYRRVKDRVPEEDYIVPIGKAAIRRSGADLTIVTYGAMVWTALEAAEILERDGVSAEVLDLRTLLPLDEEAILASVRRTGKCLVLHEDTRTGGLGAEIAATLSEKAFEWLDGPILRVTAPDTPVPYSPPLEEAFLPNVNTLLAAARKLVRY